MTQLYPASWSDAQIRDWIDRQNDHARERRAKHRKAKHEFCDHGRSLVQRCDLCEEDAELAEGALE